MDVGSRIDRITTDSSNSPSGRRIIVKGYEHGGRLLAKARYQANPNKAAVRCAVLQFIRQHGITGTFHRTPTDSNGRSTLTRFSADSFIHFP